MQVIEKNAGPKVDYRTDDTYLSLRDGELILDLAKYERDFPVHLDICENKFGMLTMGVSCRYVAQVDIPAREHDYIADGVDEEGNLKEVPVPVPFDMGNATLTLWATGGGSNE